MQLTVQTELFDKPNSGSSPSIPGLRYLPDFIDADTEAASRHYGPANVAQ